MEYQTGSDAYVRMRHRQASGFAPPTTLELCMLWWIWTAAHDHPDREVLFFDDLEILSTFLLEHGS